MPPVFGWLYKQGNIAPEEMLRTFNCGLGGVLVVESKHVEVVLNTLKENGEEAFSVGIIGHKMDEKPQVLVKGKSTIALGHKLPQAQTFAR